MTLSSFTLNLTRIFVLYFLFDYLKTHFYFQFGILLSSILCDILVNFNINIYMFFVIFCILGFFDIFDTKNIKFIIIVLYNLMLLWNYGFYTTIKRKKKYHTSIFNFLIELENCTDENYECFICLENYKEKPNLKILYCSHVFHPDCLLTWVEKNKDIKCPVCKKDIIECNEIIVV